MFFSPPQQRTPIDNEMCRMIFAYDTEVMLTAINVLGVICGTVPNFGFTDQRTREECEADSVKTVRQLLKELWEMDDNVSTMIQIVLHSPEPVTFEAFLNWTSGLSNNWHVLNTRDDDEEIVRRSRDHWYICVPIGIWESYPLHSNYI